MASLADVQYIQLKADETRKFGTSLQNTQSQLNKKREKQGWGRAIGGVAGGLLGLALAPATGGASLYAAMGAGVGSWLGSTKGADSVKVDEIEKGKLFKDQVDEARAESTSALTHLDELSRTQAFKDAYTAYNVANLLGGGLAQAVKGGAETSVGSLGEGAGFLDRVLATGKGGVEGALDYGQQQLYKHGLSDTYDSPLSSLRGQRIEQNIANQVAQNATMSYDTGGLTAEAFNPRNITKTGDLASQAYGLELPDIPEELRFDDINMLELPSSKGVDLTSKVNVPTDIENVMASQRGPLQSVDNTPGGSVELSMDLQHNIDKAFESMDKMKDFGLEGPDMTSLAMRGAPTGESLLDYASQKAPKFTETGEELIGPSDNWLWDKIWNNLRHDQSLPDHLRSKHLDLRYRNAAPHFKMALDIYHANKATSRPGWWNEPGAIDRAIRGEQ